ncbi:MAG: hypothetical protein AMXMBFR84_23230 [Candidatus Hydrogenedentota bacterium]
MNIYRMLEHLGWAIVDKDFKDANRYLAPWVLDDIGPNGLREAIDEHIRTVADELGLESSGYPSEVEVDSDASSLSDLSDTGRRSIYPEVTDKNFREWCCILFLGDGDKDVDAWLDMWVAVVEIKGELKIGYFELAYPD